MKITLFHIKCTRIKGIGLGRKWVMATEANMANLQQHSFANVILVG